MPLVGRHKAFELLFSGASFSATDAERLGLVNRVVPDHQVAHEARALALTLAAKSPVIMKMGKDAFMRATLHQLRRDLESVVDTLCSVIDTPASKEGLSAFVEKRTPKW